MPMTERATELAELLYDTHPTGSEAQLAVDSGHRLHYEDSGAEAGLPAVCLHGGPGSGSSAMLARYFDPGRYRVVVYDQRGAGRSEPRGGLSDNATPALVADLETLREHLRIDRWLLFGGSWGATLALCYAQAYPQRVRGLVLRGPLLGRSSELDWFFGPGGVARIYPREYRAFLEALPADQRAEPLRGYHALFQSRPEDAARAWSGWNHRVTTGRVRADDAPVDVGACAIACHYAVHGFFLPERGLLADMGALRGIPGIIVQGQRDLVCPAENAMTLAQHWPDADLRLVEDGGHLATEPVIARELVRATDELAATD